MIWSREPGRTHNDGIFLGRRRSAETASGKRKTLNTVSSAPNDDHVPFHVTTHATRNHHLKGHLHLSQQLSPHTLRHPSQLGSRFPMIDSPRVMDGSEEARACLGGGVTDDRGGGNECLGKREYWSFRGMRDQCVSQIE
jgi:hypothetical protein